MGMLAFKSFNFCFVCRVLAYLCVIVVDMQSSVSTCDLWGLLILHFAECFSLLEYFIQLCLEVN